MNARGYAGLAHLVEQLIRNQQVPGSSPGVGSMISRAWEISPEPVLFESWRTAAKICREPFWFFN